MLACAAAKMPPASCSGCCSCGCCHCGCCHCGCCHCNCCHCGAAQYSPPSCHHSSALCGAQTPGGPTLVAAMALTSAATLAERRGAGKSKCVGDTVRDPDGAPDGGGGGSTTWGFMCGDAGGAESASGAPACGVAGRAESGSGTPVCDEAGGVESKSGTSPDTSTKASQLSATRASPEHPTGASSILPSHSAGALTTDKRPTSSSIARTSHVEAIGISLSASGWSSHTTSSSPSRAKTLSRSLACWERRSRMLPLTLSKTDLIQVQSRFCGCLGL
mmetsp:Transcript_62117/g.173499  ORF Transcript_62117/g.173499 Transcript_62117/m.173499 type:complete len:275 (+) Transcript_62117:247-1071(+)